MPDDLPFDPTHHYAPPGTPFVGLNRTVDDFRRWAYDNVMMNRDRSLLAEYLVGLALGALGERRTEWDAVDLRYGEKLIEVKTAAYLQAWTQKRLSTIRDSIAPHVPDASLAGALPQTSHRPADCYVGSSTTSVVNVTPVGFAGTVAAVAVGVGRDVGGAGIEGFGTPDAGADDGVSVASAGAATEGRLGAPLDGKVLGIGAAMDWQATRATQVAIGSRRPGVATRSRFMRASRLADADLRRADGARRVASPRPALRLRVVAVGRGLVRPVPAASDGGFSSPRPPPAEPRAARR